MIIHISLTDGTKKNDEHRTQLHKNSEILCAFALNNEIFFNNNNVCCMLTPKDITNIFKVIQKYSY